jgi:hypothetical protein
LKPPVKVVGDGAALPVAVDVAVGDAVSADATGDRTRAARAAVPTTAARRRPRERLIQCLRCERVVVIVPGRDAGGYVTVPSVAEPLPNREPAELRSGS